MKRIAPSVSVSGFALMLALPLGCSQCQDPGTFSRTYSLITPAQEQVDFGDVYLSANKTRQVAVRSEGNGTIHVSRLRLEGSPAFDVRGTTDVVIQPGVEHSWNVVFTPVEVADAEAVAIVENNSENRPELRIRLHGRGVNFPSCDDGNPCTRDHFDPLLLDCIHTATLDGCDDGNACTTSDTCVAGRCLGAGVACVDTDPCTRDLCEAASGCVFINDIGACEDNEPCTAETCDPVTGCGHIPLPDGVPCGAGTNSCLATLQCQAGRCVGMPLPDGAPCTDFLACTVDDRCNNGVCAGSIPDDVQVSAATFGFATSGMIDSVAVGQNIITAERNRQFAGHGGGTLLTVVDVSQTPVRVNHTLRLPGEEVWQLAASDAAVATLSLVQGVLFQWTLRSMHLAPDNALVADLTITFSAPSSSPSDVLTVMGQDAWECTTGMLRRWQLPALTLTTTAVPCTQVDADASQQRLWVVSRSQPTPGAYELHRVNVTVSPPAVETSAALPPAAFGVKVLDGVGVFVTTQSSGNMLWALDGVTLLEQYGTGAAGSVEPGRALVYSNGSLWSVARTAEGLDSVMAEPVLYASVSQVACAQQTCLLNGSSSALLHSPAHGAEVTRVKALGMGGFNRLVEVNGDVLAVSPVGVHKLEVGAGLDVTQSLYFQRKSGLVSWQVDGQAPVLGDLSPDSAGAAVLGGKWGTSTWSDARLNNTGAVLGTFRDVGQVSRHGRYLYGAQLQGPIFTTMEWLLWVFGWDTASWVPGAPSHTEFASALEDRFLEPRIAQTPMVRVSPDGQHVLVVLPFTLLDKNNAVLFFGYLADGGLLTLDWTARLSTPGRYVHDAAYAHPDMLLITGPEEDFGTAVEHYRYLDLPGSIDFRGAVPAASAHLHALLLYDGDIAMAGTETGVEVFLVGENEPAAAGVLNTLEPPTDLQVLGQRLWVTGQHSVEVFFPPCPPDITPP